MNRLPNSAVILAAKPVHCGWISKEQAKILKNPQPMDTSLIPTIAYLFLAGGLAIGVLSLMAPGTGLLEIAAFFAIVISGFIVYRYEIPVNAWALIELLIGAGLFFLSIRGRNRLVWLVLAILFLVTGSAYLFQGDAWWQPGVNPVVAAVVSIVLGIFFWFAAQKSLEIREMRPTHDLDALIGAVGEAKTDVLADGSVQVAGELWSARSEQRIARGATVRVVKRDGLLLLVEPVKPENEKVL